MLIFPFFVFISQIQSNQTVFKFFLIALMKNCQTYIDSIAASSVLRGFPTRPTWEMNMCEALTVVLLNPNKYISWDCPVPLTHYTMVFGVYEITIFG